MPRVGQLTPDTEHNCRVPQIRKYIWVPGTLWQCRGCAQVWKSVWVENHEGKVYKVIWTRQHFEQTQVL